MLTAAILGAGPVGAAIAQRLAEQDRVREIVFVDENANLAAGKALDIRQCGPVVGSGVSLRGTADPLAAVGAGVIVFADDSAGGAWTGDRGLALVERLLRAGAEGPLVFAAPDQITLMETAARELRVDVRRIVASAPAAMASIAAALVHIETGLTGAAAPVAGRPPAGVVVGWGAATIGGALVSERVPPHRLRAISQTLPRFWPPGPQAIAAATTPIVTALLEGARRPLAGAAILDGEFDVRGRAGLVMLELAHGRIQRRFEPTLTPQERTETITALMRGD